MDNEIKKISKFNIKTILFIIIIFIAIISLGTFAWLTYRSNDTSMVYTVGDINNVEITLSPYQIKSTIAPVTSYTSEKYTNVTAINNSDTARDIKLYYQINSIAEELKITSFKYTIERSTNNGTSYTQYKTGNFVSAVSGNNMTILEESMPSNTTYKYKVYIWLDGSMGNQASASGKTLDCELRASIAENQYQVTFNPNGGVVSNNYKVVKYGEPYGDLPIPTREGYTFLGWKNTIFTESDLVNSTKWTANQNVTVTKNSDYTQVIYNQNNSTPGYIYRVNNDTFETGKTYTISAYVKAITDTTLQIGVYGTSSNFPTLSTSSFTKVSKTFTFNSATQNFILLYKSTPTIGSGFQIKYLQVQVGDTASEYDVTSTTVVNQENDHTLMAFWKKNS